MNDANDFELSSYHYDLPAELIAQYPHEAREKSRLMIFNDQNKSLQHSHVYELANNLPPNSLLVFNESKVFPCRLRGKKESGGEAEIFLLSLDPENSLYPCLVKASGKRKVGDIFLVEEQKIMLKEITPDGVFMLDFINCPDVASFVEKHGKIPLPHYIRGGEEVASDRERYQTVYSKNVGSVAAPTAGLHFTPNLLSELQKAGHGLAFVTLHVGLGTFRPVKASDIREHSMHEEKFYVAPEEAKKIQDHQGPVIAVGTTSLRVLESCYQGDRFNFPKDWSSTNIFLHPGKKVKSIQGLFTNFHLPESSLLMLVSSLISRKQTLELYATAVVDKYRFFSYGDAMLLLGFNEKKG